MLQVEWMESTLSPTTLSVWIDTDYKLACVCTLDSCCVCAVPLLTGAVSCTVAGTLVRESWLRGGKKR